LHPIQARAILPALQGKDVLGAAKTGSGKTLAFLVPILTRLHMMKWGPHDGVGAVILSPTRELAKQTFDALKKIIGHHRLSVARILGGLGYQEERKRMGGCNILVATPARLLDHLDNAWDASSVKVLG
jgi:ATP-dependent RNA helicase DDX10/DBP4